MTIDGSARFRVFHDLVRLPAGGGAEIVYTPLSRSTHLLTTTALRALFACRGIATLDEHAARAAALGLAPASFRQALEIFAKQGLLVSEGSLATKLCAHADSRPAAKITTLGIPTRDRPDLVRRAVASYADDADRRHRDLRIAVVDQSVDVSSRHALRELAASRPRSSRVKIAHVGPADMEAFVERLVRRGGFDPETLRFALLAPRSGPGGPGRSRNAIALLHAGEMIAMADDDTQAIAMRAPGASADLGLTSLHEPSEHWFFRAGEGDLVREDADVCGLHETLLGRLPGDVARGQVVDLSRASSMFFRRLDPRGGRVRLTHLGARGDAGTGSMLHLLALTGPSRDRLLASEEVYRNAMASREVTSAATRPTIGDGGHCMSMAIAIDARELLPPFSPRLRNEDGVFGLALRVAWHDAFAGFVPATIAHDPPARSGSFDDRFAMLGKLGGGDILAQLVLASRVEADVGDPAASLRVLGETLARWGSRPLAEFEEIVRLHVLRARSRDLALYEEIRSAFGSSPAFWARDVEHVIFALRESVTKADVAWPFDLCAELGESGGREALRQLVRGYGELLKIWPEVWSVAAELREQEPQLGVEF